MDYKLYGLILNFCMILVTFAAFIISIFALFETRKYRIESHQAKIVFNMFNLDGTLYIYVTNMGQVLAYDLNIQTTKEFVLLFKNISAIPPRTTYRQAIAKSSEIGQYPAKLSLQIGYKDIYSFNKIYSHEIQFDLIQYVRYTGRWNKDMECYDITQI